MNKKDLIKLAIEALKLMKESSEELSASLCWAFAYVIKSVEENIPLEESVGDYTEGIFDKGHDFVYTNLAHLEPIETFPMNSAYWWDWSDFDIRIKVLEEELNKPETCAE